MKAFYSVGAGVITLCAASLAPANAATCRLVDAAAQNQVITAKDSADINDQVFTPPDKPSELACLDSIFRQGGDTMTAGGFGGGSNTTELLNRACGVLEDQWNSISARIEESLGLPYGLVDTVAAQGYEVVRDRVPTGYAPDIGTGSGSGQAPDNGSWSEPIQGAGGSTTVPSSDTSSIYGSSVEGASIYD